MNLCEWILIFAWNILCLRTLPLPPPPLLPGVKLIRRYKMFHHNISCLLFPSLACKPSTAPMCGSGLAGGGVFFLIAYC